jgi:tetrahydromethanopterin S-methyltransferase subunit A
LPVPAYNTFNEIIDGLDAAGDDSMHPLKTELIRPPDFVAQNWPAQPGNYRVIKATKSIAVALLQGADLDDPSLAEVSANVAIIGTITTENLGVEHLVKNVIANPYLRHLLLWGADIEGHLPGDALRNLSGKGMDRSKRIIGAAGARPVLKNITQSEVRHFMRQIKLSDLAGQRDASELARHVELLDEQAAQPYEAGLKVDWVEIKRATPAKRLKLDPAGYFVIMAMKGKRHPLLVEHYRSDGTLRNMVEGQSAADICAELIEQKLVTQLDHAAYLGRELAKAEMSLFSESKYTQDKAPGKLQGDRE